MDEEEEGVGSPPRPPRPVPGPPAPRGPSAALIGRMGSARLAHWSAALRSTRPRWRAGSRRAAGRRASRRAEGGGGSAPGAWRVRDCGRQPGAGCCAEATAGRGLPRPHPPALAAARRVPEPTAPAPRARRPRTARTSARTCGRVTRTCGGWCTVGDAGWAVRRRASAWRRPADGGGTVPIRPGCSLLEASGGARQGPQT